MSNEYTHDEVRQILGCSQLLAGLSEGAIRAMASAMNPEDFEAGELIIRQGEPGRCFYIIASGCVQVRVKFDGANSAVVATLSAGDSVGEMSLLSGDPTSADVAAVEKTRALTLDRQSFNALVEAHPTLLREFVRLLSRRLRTTDVAVKDARADEEALAKFLRETGSEPWGDLIGKHSSVASLKREVDRQSESGAPLVILGERGTGKKLVARLIHARGRRREAPFVSVECRLISETPWGDKLFGRYQSEDDGKMRAHGVCYMTLATGGTILLKDIELLPTLIQARLALFLCQQASDGDGPGTDIRFIATAASDLSDLAKAGKFSSALSEAFTGNRIIVPALRGRKRDIPELANHFILEHCGRLDVPVKRLSDQALTRLVSYDYDIANVLELKEALERAVVLADNDTIGAEEIFLGAPAKARKTGFNFLALKTTVVRKATALFPKLSRPIVAVVFAFTLYQCFFGTPRGEGNPGTTLTWALMWPALALSYFFVGRLWCAVCPMAFAGAWVQRWRNLKWPIPSWIKDYDTDIGLIGFVAIIWVEESTAMRHSPLATGVLLITIVAGALGASLLFPRRTWCRHLCPLGSFCGLCARSALLELRPTPDICAAKCTGHSCYKGGDGIEGCPVFNHLMFVDSNQNCILCMNCVQSCPNESPRLNLRWPAAEIWTQAKPESAAGRFIGVLLALLAVLALIQYWDTNAQGVRPELLGSHRTLFLSAAMLLSVAIPLLLFWAHARLLPCRANSPARELFWRKVLAWGPLVTAGFVCYQLAYIPGIRNLQVALSFHPLEPAGQNAVWVPLLDVLRCAILTAGLLTTFGVIWKIAADFGVGGAGNRLKPYAVSLLSVTVYAAVLLVLMTKPQWLGF